MLGCLFRSLAHLENRSENFLPDKAIVFWENESRLLSHEISREAFIIALE